MAVGTNIDAVEIADPHDLTKVPVSVRTQGGVVFDMAFSPAGAYVATANADGSVSLVAVGRQRKLGHPLPTAPVQWGLQP